MKATQPNLVHYEGMLKVLDSIAQHKASSPIKSEGMYYQLVHDYYERPLLASQQGKPVAAYSVLIPSELLYAMDITPLFLEGSSVSMAVSLKNYEEFYSAAKSLGYAPEICSVHRCIIAAYSQKWTPRPDVVIWSNHTCDNNVKSVDPILRTYEIPGIYADAPYHFEERHLEYYAQELEDMVASLERITGRKLDPDRLAEALKLSQQAVELFQEIYRLRRAVPSPLPNRRPQQMVSIMRSFMGSPQAVEYLRVVRDEARALVQAGKGPMPQENFRLVSLFGAPNHNWKLLDWMERQHGAAIVADPHNSHWQEFDWDYSQPFLTLARRIYYSPTCRQMCGPLSQGLLSSVVEDATAAQAQGAIWWAHIGCRQACAAISSIKDILREQADIPTLVLDVDIVDPTFVSDDELKEKLEGFFELLEARK